MTGFSYTDMQKNANGGTELVCRLLQERLPADLLEHFQIIPSRVQNIEEDKIRIYFIHDLPNDPETNHIKNESSRARFHKIVFCGHWQYNAFLNQLGMRQDDQLIVIDNPVIPIEYVDKSKDEVRLIYTSTPQRGLSLLVPVFEKLCESHDNIHLDVFSSFKIYGWDDPEPFKELFERCNQHPKITYHGHASNATVREYLQKAHIFAYPSIWQECNSRALIEAMSAGLLCVHPNLAGLSDTSGNMTSMYQFIENHNEHAGKFFHRLDNSIKIVNTDQVQEYLKYVKTYADTRFNVDRIVAQWRNMLEGLLHTYSDPASRRVPQAMFSYRTS